MSKGYRESKFQIADKNKIEVRTTHLHSAAELDRSKSLAHVMVAIPFWLQETIAVAGLLLFFASMLVL